MENSNLTIAHPVTAAVNEKSISLRSDPLALPFITPASACKNKDITIATHPFPNTS